MAAAELAGTAAAAPGHWAHRGYEWLSKSSAKEMARTLFRVGAGLILGGFGLGTAGYFLKAASTAAANNEVTVLSNIGTIFSNIKAPTFSPALTGTAPLSWSLQGVQNFASNALQDVQAAGADVAQIGAAIGTAAEDVGIAVTDLAKAFLAFVTHFPDILWNGAVWGIGGATADILNWLFPWLVILGLGCILVGMVISLAAKSWASVAQPAWERASGKWAARLEARVERGFDRLFGNFRETTAVAVAPAPILPVASSPPLPAGPDAGQPAPGGGEGTAAPVVPPGAPARAYTETRVPTGPEGTHGETVQGLETPAPPAEIAPEGPPAAQEPPEPTTPAAAPTPPAAPQAPAEPPPGVMTRPEAEAYLGDRPNRAPTPEEIRAMIEEAEVERQKTLPKKDPPVSGYAESRKAADAFAAAEAAP